MLSLWCDVIFQLHDTGKPGLVCQNEGLANMLYVPNGHGAVEEGLCALGGLDLSWHSPVLLVQKHR